MTETVQHDFAAKFAGMQDAWDDARKGPKRLGEGNYSFALQEFALDSLVSKEDIEYTVLNIEAAVIEGDMEGKVHREKVFITNRDGQPSGLWKVSMLIRQLGGSVPDDISAVPAAIEEVRGRAPVFEGELVADDRGYHNIRVNNLLA